MTGHKPFSELVDKMSVSVRQQIKGETVTQGLQVRNADEGKQVLVEVDSLVDKLAAAEVELSTFRTKIGILLDKVEANKYWRDAGCESFGAYMMQVEQKFNRGRTQLYHFKGVAHDLLPFMSEDQLNSTSLEKAKLLRKHKDEITPEIIDAATDSKVSFEDFKQLLVSGLPAPKSASGVQLKRFNLEYCADEETQATITDALSAAAQTEPDSDAVPVEIKLGNTLYKLAAEFLGSNGDPYGEEV